MFFFFFFFYFLKEASNAPKCMFSVYIIAHFADHFAPLRPRYDRYAHAVREHNRNYPAHYFDNTLLSYKRSYKY